MRYLVAAALALTACATAKPVCTTARGMLLMPTVPDAGGWECSMLQCTEDAAMRAFADVTDPRFVTPDLKGWRITVRQTVAWDTRYGVHVAGQTHCPDRLIEVGSTPLPSGSLVHEMAHAIQGCMPLGPLDPADPDHSNWGTDGINLAIARARTECP